MKLSSLVRYSYGDVERWLARQLELSRGGMAPCRVVQICSALLIRTDLHPGLSVRQMIHRPGQGGGEKFLHGSVAAVPRAQLDHLRWWALYIHQADDVVNCPVSTT